MGEGLARRDDDVAARACALREAATAAAVARGLGEARAWTEARNALAATCRELALHVLTARRVPWHAADDLAGEVAMRVLPKIEGDLVGAGAESAYVATAARRAAHDWHRAQSGVRRREDIFDEYRFERDEATGGRAAPDDDDAELRAREQLAALRAALKDAPAAHRAIIEEVHFAGVSLEELVDRDLAALGSRGASVATDDSGAAERRRVRARIDKRMQRARDWLRARMAALLGAGPID